MKEYRLHRLLNRIVCVNKTINYGVVEEKYNFKIKAIDFDIYNAISNAQK